MRKNLAAAYIGDKELMDVHSGLNIAGCDTVLVIAEGLLETLAVIINNNNNKGSLL